MPSASICREHGFRRAASIAVAVMIVSLQWVPRASAQTTDPSLPPRSASHANPFRSRTELVALQVSVVDSQRRYVTDLSEQEFAVLEEGTPQHVTLFAAATTPVDVMVLLDTSSSMTDRMKLAQKAAIDFLHALRPGDRAAIILFNTRVRVAHPLTTDIAALEAAVHSTSASGGTALHEAVYIALHELTVARRGDERLRRQALVVLTDGDDTSSSLSFDDVLEEVRRSTVTIFTIMPAPALPPPTTFSPIGWPRPVMPFDLRVLADETGGRAFMPAPEEDLSGTYRAIADELTHQYWLAYAPKPSDGGFKRISVQVVSRPGLRARTRSGYYARDLPRESRFELEP